jgi:hypothetical protein
VSALDRAGEGKEEVLKVLHPWYKAMLWNRGVRTVGHLGFDHVTKTIHGHPQKKGGGATLTW